MRYIYKNIKLILILTIVGIGSSCNLDEVPYFYTDDNAFVNQENAIQAVNGIYEPIYSAFGRSHLYLNELPTDACYKKESDLEIYNEGVINQNDNISACWLGSYKMIARANLAITKIENMEDAQFQNKEKPSRDRLLGEAYFLRALAYYHLTDLYYKVPLVIDSDTNVDAKIPLSPIEDVEQQILSDLDKAKGKLPEWYPTVADGGRAIASAVYGLECKLYMRKAGRARIAGQGDVASLWKNAEKAVDEVLKREQDGVLKLQTKVWNIFDPTSDATLYNNEIILAVRSRGAAPGSTDIGMSFTPWDYDMGWNLMNVPLEMAWMMDPADERYSKLLVTNYRNVYEKNKIYYKIPEDVTKAGTVYQENVPEVGYRTEELEAAYTQKYKYLHTGKYNYNTNNNVVLMRLADFILCKAEILNELGLLQEAISHVNRVRERAFQNPNHNLDLTKYATQNALREAISDERLFELNNEGHRRPDLIRMGLWKNRMDSYIAKIKLKSEWKEKNSKASSKPDFSSDWKVYPNNFTENDKRRYFPIPKIESDLNPEYLSNRDF